jgi:GTP-binding protein YchF
MLTCGIIGLPLAGKTTLFNILTNANAETSAFQSGRTEANVGITRVPDKRIDYLSSMFKPKKTTYAQIEYTDIVGLTPSAGQVKGGNPFLAAIRDVDALVHVVRVFENDEVVHPLGGVDPVRDFNNIWLELFLADLDIVEKRIAKIKASKKRTKELDVEQAALEKCQTVLEAEKPISTAGLTEDEKAVLRSFTFLTEKPMLVVVNVDENQLRSAEYPGKEPLYSLLSGMNISVMEVCAKAESEISQLDEGDRQLFMEELGIDEPGIDKVARVTYNRLGLISFFTVGEDEVKAWTITRGLEAKPAAGKIHSDIERGFIRAEVVSFDVLKEYGSVARAREKGLYRLEGRDYVVLDGDIINFRFNA